MKPTCSLYLAYGSNLSIRRMLQRCPAATPLHKFLLQDSKLVFRGVADCPRVEGASCYGGLWRITAECEESLDRYEGVHGGFYRKEYIPLERGKFEADHMMMYVMNSSGVFPPAQSYLETIADGYRDFKLPMDVLKEAVRHSHDHRSPTSHELSRHRRRGLPTLASRPRINGESFPPPVTGDARELEYDPPRRESRKWDGTSRTRASLDGWLEERRRDRDSRQARAQRQRGNFDLFDEWWHTPLVDND